MNNQTFQLSSTVKFFVAVAAIAITLFFIKSASSMLNSFVLAVIIVMSATPLLYSLKRKGVPSMIAYAITLIVILVVIVAVVLFVILALVNFVEAVPTYAKELQSAVDTIIEYLGSIGLTERLSLDAFRQVLDPGRLLTFVVGFFGGLLNGLSNIFLVALIIIFLLVDALSVPEKLAPYIRRGDPLVTRLSTFGGDIRLYIIVTTIVGLVTGVIDTVFFIIMGVDFPLLWGALAFFMSYIPTIGFWLALIPPVFLALLESGPVAAIVVFIGIVLINGFAETVVKPKYMGEELDLSPFTVVFSVVVWSAILGPLGAILSVPMTMAFKSLILEPDPTTRWLADLMSADSHDQTGEATIAVDANGDLADGGGDHSG